MPPSEFRHPPLFLPYINIHMTHDSPKPLKRWSVILLMPGEQRFNQTSVHSLCDQSIPFNNSEGSDAPVDQKKSVKYWLRSPLSSHWKSVPGLIHPLGNEPCFSSSLIPPSHGRSLCFCHPHVTKSSYTSISKKPLPN